MQDTWEKTTIPGRDKGKSDVSMVDVEEEQQEGVTMEEEEREQNAQSLARKYRRYMDAELADVNIGNDFTVWTPKAVIVTTRIPNQKRRLGLHQLNGEGTNDEEQH